MQLLKEAFNSKGVIRVYTPKSLDTSIVDLWANNGKPFFNDDVHGVWNVYSMPKPGITHFPSVESEREERRRFVENSVLAAVDQTYGVVGGIWVDTIEYSKKNPSREVKVANFHISFLRERRELAYHLMAEFEKHSTGHYSAIKASWGERPKHYDPSGFFSRNGFEVREVHGITFALKNLE